MGETFALTMILLAVWGPFLALMLTMIALLLKEAKDA